jgi:hypothetical protein
MSETLTDDLYAHLYAQRSGYHEGRFKDIAHDHVKCILLDEVDRLRVATNWRPVLPPGGTAAESAREEELRAAAQRVFERIEALRAALVHPESETRGDDQC